MQSQTPDPIFARHALTADGWQHDVCVSIAADGTIARVSSGTPHPHAHDLLLCGMANVHSHAFQRAMAGLTERAGGSSDDNFWSWREVMYRFLATLSPDHVEIIARAFYIELLKAGYTSVGEFHYLHHAQDGAPYANPAEMSDRIIAAAQSSGITLRLLPVLYQTSTFGGAPATEGQRRFVHATDAYLRLLETLAARGVSLGIAPHSLRAVPLESLAEIVAALPSLGLEGCPIHIHAAEQIKEVEDCVQWSGQRPVEWLLNHEEINARWCFIHATHLNDAETIALARSGAVAGLCPSTEANLGDGIFPARAYLKFGGRFAIGTDSHVCINPWEELRLLESSQRLTHHARAVLHGEATSSVGRHLFDQALHGGARALGWSAPVIATGARADLVSYDLSHWLFEGREGDTLLDTLLLCDRPPVRDVWVGGRQVVTGGHHAAEEKSFAALRNVMKTLLS